MGVTRRILCVLVIIVFFMSGSSSVMGADKIDLSDNVALSINPFEYGSSPDGKYLFLYTGKDPYYSLQIDTSTCKMGALYVYDQYTDSIIELADDGVICYTGTKDSVFYGTDSGKVFKTDYLGISSFCLYQGTRGMLSEINTYLQQVYFVEDGQFLMLLDTKTGGTKTVCVHPGIIYATMISAAQIVFGTHEDIHYMVNVESGEITQLESDYAASALITEAVLSAAEMTVLETPSAGIMSVYAPSAVNDISFPLDEYPARVPDTDDFQEIYKNGARPVPLSWFHIDQNAPCSSTNCIQYRHANECQGFAMYAHDIYHHIYEPDGGYSAWFSDRHSNETDIDFENNETKLLDFISQLNEGALIRYYNGDDSHPENFTKGNHALIYVSRDNNGIWVYECNQKYKGVSAGNCGIHYQYYTFINLLSRYKLVVYHINHTYNTTWEYESGYYHKFNCSQQLSSGDACACYRRVMHDSLTVSFVSIVQHRSVSACCGTHDENHTEPLEYICVSNTQHKVQAGCCDDEISQNHMFVNDRCKLCHYLKDSMAINRTKSRNIQAVAITE